MAALLPAMSALLGTAFLMTRSKAESQRVPIAPPSNLRPIEHGNLVERLDGATTWSSEPMAQFRGPTQGQDLSLPTMATSDRAATSFAVIKPLRTTGAGNP